MPSRAEMTQEPLVLDVIARVAGMGYTAPKANLLGSGNISLSSGPLQFQNGGDDSCNWLTRQHHNVTFTETGIYKFEYEIHVNEWQHKTSTNVTVTGEHSFPRGRN